MSKRRLIATLLIVFLSLGLFFVVRGALPVDEEGLSLGSNLAVVFSINLVAILLVLLIYVVGRNITKLIFDRRKQILGSRLRLKLVVAFVSLSLVPTVLLFVFASGLLNRAIEEWFKGPVNQGLEAALLVARTHLAELKEETATHAQLLVSEIQPRLIGSEPRLNSEPKRAQLKQAMEEARTAHSLFSIRLLAQQSGGEIFAVSNIVQELDDFKEPPVQPEFVEKLRESLVQLERHGSQQFVRAYRIISVNNRAYVLVATKRVSSELSYAFDSIDKSYRDFAQLQAFRAPLKTSYILTLSVVTGFILFSSVWAGFFISRQLSEPLQRVLEGTLRVSQGDYNFSIADSGDDEMGFLVRSFNTMTADLKSASSEVALRRQYLETILKRLAVSVISLDPDQKVTAINSAAARLFGFEEEEVLGKSVDTVLPAELSPVVKELCALPDDTASRDAGFFMAGRERIVVVSKGVIRAGLGDSLGSILIFDETTELRKAQALSAWREVAKRLAHEIKNPLTPIKVSAQRIERALPQHPLAQECVSTILDHVQSITRLVDAFSRFAKLPSAEFQPVSLPELFSDLLPPFIERYGQIRFQEHVVPELPLVDCDPEQIRRVVINLLENAVQALAESVGEVDFSLSYIPLSDVVQIEVSDTGPGISQEQKTRIFEPYFTTKKEGSGLGLAIVSTIISDHGGTIRVFDRQPSGARFVIELPRSHRVKTARL